MYWTIHTNYKYDYYICTRHTLQYHTMDEDCEVTLRLIPSWRWDTLSSEQRKKLLCDRSPLLLTHPETNTQHKVFEYAHRFVQAAQESKLIPSPIRGQLLFVGPENKALITTNGYAPTQLFKLEFPRCHPMCTLNQSVHGETVVKHDHETNITYVLYFKQKLN